MTPVRTQIKELFFRLLKTTFHSNGKLLLTGEYVVLDGAKALAIPTKYGQSLEIETSEKEGIHWKSFDETGAVWFQGHFEIIDGQIVSQNPSDPIGNQLLKILQEAKKLNPKFLDDSSGFNVKTNLDFPRNWGLGTSSTLISNIAQWAQIDAFALLGRSFGGSGYDIAAAQNDCPILYEVKDGKPTFKKVDHPWDFTDRLFFVHLNQKQDSKEGIAQYRNALIDKKSLERISKITKELISCTTLPEFEKLMNAHEEIISEIINLPTIKTQLFSDYPNTIKSLGAWGGDFILVTGDEKNMEYFRKKDFKTIVPFDQMIH